MIACKSATWTGLQEELSAVSGSINALPSAVTDQPWFVVPAREIRHLEQLLEGLPKPATAEWINRGTGQLLRPSTVAMLLRTLPRREGLSPSAERLHLISGLRLAFGSPQERNTFARAWSAMIK